MKLSDLYDEKPVEELTINGQNSILYLPMEFSLLNFQKQNGKLTFMVESMKKEAKSAKYSPRSRTFKYNNYSKLTLTESKGSIILGFNFDIILNNINIWVLSPCEELEKEEHSIFIAKIGETPPGYKFLSSCIGNNSISMFRAI